MPAKRTRKAAAHGTLSEDVPYVMRLADGWSVFVLLRPEWCERDVTGELLLKPPAVRFLDRVRALAMRTPAVPTPGYIRALRDALGWTQVELAERVGVDSMTVSRWERGAVRPSPAATKALARIRREAGARGVSLAA